MMKTNMESCIKALNQSWVNNKNRSAEAKNREFSPKKGTMVMDINHRYKSCACITGYVLHI